MIDINLLPQQNVSTIEENKIKKYSLLGVLGFSMVWVLVVGGLFVYKSNLSSQKDSLLSSKTSLQSRLNEQNEQIGNLLSLKQKVSGISFIEKSRFDLPGSLKYLFPLFPTGVNVTKIAIDEDGLVAMDLKSTDSQVVSEFLSSMGKDKILKNPTLSAFKQIEDGSYVFTITAQYGSKNLKSVNN